MDTKYTGIMCTREKSKEWIKETCGDGWLELVDEVYNKLPNYLNVIQAYQKWGVLRFNIDKEDSNFEKFLESIESKSAELCEKCGFSAIETTIDGWVHTRCDKHSNEK